MIEEILEYARTELNIMGLDTVELGSTILILLKQIHDLAGNRPRVMRELVMAISNLIDKKPITPVTEHDFDDEGNCKRYPHIHRKPDGRYYNNRAVAYKTSYDDPGNQYRSSSRREITVPYTVRESIEIISDTE
jgi:hypothetical protein